MTNVMERNKYQRCLGTLEYIDVFTHIWGVTSVIVLWGVGIDLTFHSHSLGAYMLFLAILLTVLETAFAFNIFLDFFIKDDKHICIQCCQGIQWLDFWKKSVLYIFFSFFCFMKPAKMWLAAIGGVMLIILALLYLITSYKVHLTMQEALIFDKECSYDRFDDLQEEIDDSLPEPSSGNVGDQDRILQV